MCNHTGDLTEIKLSIQENTLATQSMGKTVDRIEKLAKDTNGRVGKLEQWKSYITGGLVILSILVIPIVLWILEGAIT